MPTIQDEGSGLPEKPLFDEESSGNDHVIAVNIRLDEDHTKCAAIGWYTMHGRDSDGTWRWRFNQLSY